MARFEVKKTSENDVYDVEFFNYGKNCGNFTCKRINKGTYKENMEILKSNNLDKKELSYYFSRFVNSLCYRIAWENEFSKDDWGTIIVTDSEICGLHQPVEDCKYL
jgi:hypothetical protein